MGRINRRAYMSTFGPTPRALAACVRRPGDLVAVIEGTLPGVVHIAAPALTDGDRRELDRAYRCPGVQFWFHEGVEGYLAHLRERTDALARRCGLPA